MPTCYRHQTRETGVSCSSCGRPICTDCMTPTSVGMRCPECSRERTRVHRVPSGRLAAAGWSATNVLIAINVVAFLAEVMTGVRLGGQDSGWVFYHGVLFGPFISVEHQYWRLLTAGFLHASLIHILFNMVALWWVGRVLEPAVGSRWFTVIYFASLLSGSFGALLFQPDAPTLGASTGIFGIFGALILVARARGISIWQSGLGPLLLLNFAITLTFPDISIGGHVGGLIGGLICGWLVVEHGERRDRAQWVYGGCALVALLGVIGGVAVAGGSGLLPHGVGL